MIRTLLAALLLALSATPLTAQEPVLSASVRAALLEARRAAAADGLEHAVCFDSNDQVIGTFTGTMGNVTPLCDPARTTTLAHTHPSGAGPSEGDITTLLSPLFPNLDTSIILGSDGMVTVMRGLAGRRPDSLEAVAFIAARFVLLTDVYRIALADPPQTETWPMARLCAGLELRCFAGPFEGEITPVATDDLTVADDPATHAFASTLRDGLASWIQGAPVSTTGWGDVGRVAGSASLSGPYRQAVFIDDLGNFANGAGPFSSRANILRETASGLESFEVFAANDAPGELELCVRTGWDLQGAVEATLIDNAFVRLASGRFEVRCGSRTRAGIAKTFYQRLADGALSFYRTREDMEAQTNALGAVPANTGCSQTPESVYRTCDGTSPDTYALIEPD